MGTTLTKEQFKERYGQSGLDKFETSPIERPIETPGFFKRAGTALKDRFGEIKKTFRETAEGEITPVETGVRVVGDVAGGVGDIFGAALEPHVKKLAEKEWAKPAFEKLAQGMEAYEGWKGESELNRRTGEMLEGVVNIADLVGVTAGAKTAVKTTTRVASKLATRVFDTTKAIPERLRAVRASLPSKPVDLVEDVAKQADTAVKPTVLQRFTENPSVTGALDDIKIIVGLPENTPSVDLTFRAVKPRITKKTNLRRVKAQMQLANQTIIENGFKPKDIKSYADAIYETKKKVWGQIESKLEAGQIAGKEVNVVPMALELVRRAEDTALLRTNPTAAKQLTEMAENLVKYGDNLDILEAERMKQLLNAELDGAFGDLDMSKHAKEAKKYLTIELGKQLDEILSDLPGDFKDLKIKYGSLSAIEDDVLKRAIVFERANPEGLADVLTKTQAAAELVFGNMKSRAQAIARLTMQSRLKKANDVNEMIRRAFEKTDFSIGEIPKKTNPAVGKTASKIDDAADPLIQEAKKYKSAEEFVKAIRPEGVPILERAKYRKIWESVQKSVQKKQVIKKIKPLEKVIDDAKFHFTKEIAPKLENKKLYRGQTNEKVKGTATGGADLGKGQYFTVKKKIASQYGDVIELSKFDLPQKPLVFKNRTDYDGFIAQIAQSLGMRKAGVGLEGFVDDIGKIIRSVGDYDGVIISDGDIIVKYVDRAGSPRVDKFTKSQLTDIWKKAQKTNQ